MKKKLLSFLFIPGLLLSGCSFKDGFNKVKGTILSWFTSDRAEDTPKDEEEPQDHEKEDPEEEHVHDWHYESNAYSHWRVCECGETEPVESHHFHLDKHTDMTCTDTSHDEYVCEECGYTKLENGTEHLEHNYVSTVTKEATCQTPGVITFVCSLCGDKFTNEFTKEDAHHLVLESETSGVKTYICDVPECTFSKKVIDHSTQTEAPVTTEALKDAGEIQLKNAAIAFDDDTLEDFGEKVTISADQKDNETVVSELSLDDDVKAKLEDKPIIDFSVVKNTSEEEQEKVSEFAGSVKVTIPYTLKNGENPDCIAIWYLSEEGTESIQASYSNGYVSFETTHFSYYAVVHLTPEEVCEQFGHEMVKGNVVSSSCYAHGHDDKVCRRCGKIERTTLPLAQHNYLFSSKKDATTTSEGYIRYECSVCHDVYDTVLPKISADGKPFYVNLIYTALTPEFRIYASTELDDGSTLFYEQYQGLDYEGKPFSYSSNGYAQYKGYNYYSGSDYERYESYSSRSTLDMSYVRTIIDELPQIYKDKFNDLATFVVDKYFNKVETEEGYAISPNFAAVQHTVDMFVNESIEDALVDTIGKDNYDAILDFIAAHYEDTVEQFLNELASRGFKFEDLYEMAVRIAKSEGASEENIPSIDDILTPEIKSMKLTKAAALILSQIFHTSEEEISKSIPQTYAEFKELIDEYLHANLIEVIRNVLIMMRGEEGAPTLQEMKEMVKEVTDQFKTETISMTLKTTKEGAFISLEANINNFKVPGTSMNETGYSLITKDFDKASILQKLEEKAHKCEIRENAFTLDSEHYEWLAEAYEQYFEKESPGIQFSYMRNFNGEEYDALVSNVDVTSRVPIYDHEKPVTIDEETGEKVEPEVEYKKGKLIIRLTPDSYHYNSVYQNRYGLGDVLGKNEHGVNAYSYNYVTNPTIQFVTEGGLTSETYYGALPSFEFLFNLEKEEYHHVESPNSYDYLYKSYEKYYAMTWDEYEAYYKAQYQGSHGGSSGGIVGPVPYPYPGEEQYRDMYKPFRVVNLLDGSERVTVNYVGDNESYSNVYSTTVLSPLMDEEALEKSRNFGIVGVMVNGTIVECLQSYDRDIEKFNWHSYYSWQSSYSLGEYRDKTYEYEGVYGNVKVKFVSKTTDVVCQRTNSYSLSVNGKNISSNTYRCHLNNYDLFEDVEIGRTDIDACHYEIERAYQCKTCNKSIYQGIYSYTNHTYHTEVIETPDETYSCQTHVERVTTCENCDYRDSYTYIRHDYDPENCTLKTIGQEATLTRAGFTYEAYCCNECGKVAYDRQNFQYHAPCKHENHHMDGEELVCDDCGYRVTSPSGEVPELLYEAFDYERDGYMAFSVFAPNLDREFEYLNLDEYYNFQLCVGYFDDEGEFKVLNNDNKSEIMIERFSFKDEEVRGHLGYWCNCVVFSEYQYNDLLTMAREEYPEKELYVAIVAVAYDSGTIFYYAL